MQRVAIDVSIQGRAEPTGVERAQATLLDALLPRAGDGLQFLLLSPHAVPERWRGLADVFVAGGASRAPLWLWREAEVPGVLRVAQATLLHSPVAALPYAPPCPAIATLHELPWAEPRAAGDRRWTHRLRTAVAAARARRLVCVSERTRSHLVALHPYAAGRAVVVPNAVDPLFAPPAPGAPGRATLLGELGLDDGPYVMALGRTSAKKGFDLLLDAMAQPELRDLRLVLAGPAGRADRRLRRRAREADLKGRACLAGYLPDAALAALMGRAGCVVVPSRFEGFGLPVLEAMACGVPVVAARGGAVSEVLGEAVATCAPGSASALARAIAGVLGDGPSAAGLVARGRQQAARFSARSQAERVLALYAEAVA